MPYYPCYKIHNSYSFYFFLLLFLSKYLNVTIFLSYDNILLNVIAGLLMYLPIYPTCSLILPPFYLAAYRLQIHHHYPHIFYLLSSGAFLFLFRIISFQHPEYFLLSSFSHHLIQDKPHAFHFPLICKPTFC